VASFCELHFALRSISTRGEVFASRTRADSVKNPILRGDWIFAILVSTLNRVPLKHAEKIQRNLSQDDAAYHPL
jgi:hypothetical protein